MEDRAQSMNAQDYTPGKSGQEGTCAPTRIFYNFFQLLTHKHDDQIYTFRRPRRAGLFRAGGRGVRAQAR